jgi:tetratricopeptide (TPR) repeat protein
MLKDHPWAMITRLVLAGILIFLLDLAPRPHLLRQALNTTRRLLAQQDFSRASEQLVLASNQEPWRADLLILTGQIALQSGQPQLAIEYLEKPTAASRLGPSDLLLLGDAYQAAGDTLMAAAIWQRMAEIAPSSELFQRLADYHLSRQEYDDAIEDLRQVLRYQPANASLNYQIGLLYATVDPQLSLAYLAQAARLDPAFSASSLELLRKIRTASLYEEPAYTFTASGRVLASLDEWELAAAAFSRAVQLRPDYAEAWAFLGEARQHSPSPQAHAGLFELQQALRLDPTSVAANLLMGIYLERQGELEQALNYLQAAIQLEPDNPLLHAELGNVLSQQGDLPSAQAAFEQGISLAPTDPLFYRLLAEFSLDNQIQVREIALPAARSAVILAPDDPRNLDLFGRTLLSLGDLFNAERMVLKALRADPQLASAHLHLGMIYIQRNDLLRGRQEFTLANSLGSGTWTSVQAQRFLAYYFP